LPPLKIGEPFPHPLQFAGHLLARLFAGIQFSFELFPSGGGLLDLFEAPSELIAEPLQAVLLHQLGGRLVEMFEIVAEFGDHAIVLLEQRQAHE
jgi:hypothetical protein